MTRTRTTRRRTNIHGLTSDTILDHLRATYPKALDIRRHGDVFQTLRKARATESVKSNQRGIWETVGEFDRFRLTANGTLTTRTGRLSTQQSQ